MVGLEKSILDFPLLDKGNEKTNSSAESMIHNSGGLLAGIL